MPTQELDEASVIEWGKARAAEELAAIHCHELPTLYGTSVAVAEALYMLGAIAVSLEDEEAQERQLKLFMDRLPDVMDDLRKHHGPKKEDKTT